MIYSVWEDCAHNQISNYVVSDFMFISSCDKLVCHEKTFGMINYAYITTLPWQLDTSQNRISIEEIVGFMDIGSTYRLLGDCHRLLLLFGWQWLLLAHEWKHIDIVIVYYELQIRKLLLSQSFLFQLLRRMSTLGKSVFLWRGRGERKS